MNEQQTLAHTVTPLEHLQSCAEQIGTRPWMAKPFTVSWKLETWSAATNGHAILLMKEAVAGVGPIEPGFDSNIQTLLKTLDTHSKSKVSAAWDSVARFLAHGLPEEPLVCPLCKGKRPPVVKCHRCQGSGEIECGECGSHEKECPDCDGHGRRGGCAKCDDKEDALIEPQRGQVAPGIFVDRRLLRSVLGPMRPSELLIRHGAELDPLILSDATGTWFAIVMPLSNPLTKDELPSLELTNA